MRGGAIGSWSLLLNQELGALGKPEVSPAFEDEKFPGVWRSAVNRHGTVIIFAERTHS